MTWQEEIRQGIPDYLPSRRWAAPLQLAPARKLVLSLEEQKLAVRNALRYFSPALHEVLAREFLEELRTYGRIYMLRYRPVHPIKARPVNEYPAENLDAAAMMLMIQNNLDPDIAQYADSLVTYGGNGGVFQNWAQYRLTMQYLSRMKANQTLVMKSGHPDGLYPSHVLAPRAVITNGLVIPQFGTLDDYERLAQLGVTMYGQMTAGSWMYIGSQGIVHGTVITLMNAARDHLRLKAGENLKGKLFVSSGLGGMSGAQAKAAVVTGAVGVIAEVKLAVLQKRKDQQWLDEIHRDLPELIRRIREAKFRGEAVSLGYHGNVVDLWEALLEADIVPELGSDQTSLHDPFGGGYYPIGMTVEEANHLISHDKESFKRHVEMTLRKHVGLINALAAKGMHFWDYGNSFLDEARKAQADILDVQGKYRYSSYVQEIMGPLFFDYGFGPFRWVCLSGSDADLQVTDELAFQVINDMLREAPSEIEMQLRDNRDWIRQAQAHNLTRVGSRARILYSNALGRMLIALKFNEAIRNGRIGPVVLGRDHHDPSGTDSYLRETSDIEDGSNPTADMATQTVIGNAIRGATWVSLHHGGGTGFGKAINGGFGLLLDGSPIKDEVLRQIFVWDVDSGVSRRAWAGNRNAQSAVQYELERVTGLDLTLRQDVDPSILKSLFS